MPLIAPGIFVALLLVYIPLFTDFASPALVGGTEGYMLGNVVNDLVLESGDLNGGAAMSMLMLGASALFAIVAYRLDQDPPARVVSVNGSSPPHGTWRSSAAATTASSPASTSPRPG